MEREREREKKLLMFGRALHSLGMITRMLSLGCSRLTDSNLPGLKSTGFHRVYGQPAKLGSTLCADYNVCHVTLDFGTGEKGCENEEQMAVPPLFRVFKIAQETRAN